MNLGPIPLTLEDLAQLKSTRTPFNFPEQITEKFTQTEEMLLAYISNPQCNPQLLLNIARNLHELINTLFPQHSQHKAVEPAQQVLAANMMILAATFALSTARAFMLISIIAKKNAEVSRSVVSDMHGLCYGFIEQAEFLYTPVIEATPYLKALRRRYFDAWIAHINSPLLENMSARRLALLMEAKNNTNAEFGISFHGELIVNSNSYHLVNFDEGAFTQFVQKCALIQQRKQPRTQFVNYIHGTAGHVLAFDVSVSETGTLQIICVESAQEAKQYHYLKKLVGFLSAKNIPFAVLACQAELQRDLSTCAVFAYALCGVLSKTSFEALSKDAKVEQPSFGSRFTEVQQLPPLPFVQWFHVTKLGYKAILMSQSFTSMQANLQLMGVKEHDISTKVTQWKLWYDMDDASRKTYIDHRVKMMGLKLQGQPLANVLLDEILRKTKAKDVFQALRRLSAGFGPKRLLEALLIVCHKGKITLDLPDETKGLSAAHLSIIHQEPKRACLLLKYGASFDKANDKEPRTARDLYLASTSAILRNNPVLKQKLKG
ncbi:MAG: hypothetical protein JSR17_08630 [Proteobacteria bacterium]|nr:hypothetical protein [Pseudomonadota bacterium]